MKGILLSLILTTTILCGFSITHQSSSPATAEINFELISKANAQEVAVSPAVVEQVSDLPAAQIDPDLEKVKPYFQIVNSILSWTVQTYPKVGPMLQGAVEVIGGLGALFTLLSVFVQGVLVIPVVIARFAGAHALADKVKAFSDKWVPKLKYLSLFNVSKK